MKWLPLLFIPLLILTGCDKSSKRPDPETIDRELNLSYFPENALMIAHINIDKIFRVQAIKKLINQIAQASKKASGIDFNQLSTADLYISSKDGHQTTEIAGVINNFDLSKLRKKVKKTEDYKQYKLHFFDNKTVFTPLDQHTLIGTVNGVRELIDLKTAKGKTLAQSPRAAAFKEITSTLKNNLLSFAVVPDKVIQEQLKRFGAQHPKYAVVISDFKAGAFGIALGSKKMELKAITKLSEASAILSKTILEAKLKEVSGKVESQIQLLFPMIGMGNMVEGSIEAFRSIKIEQKNDHLTITMTISNELLAAIPQAIAMMQAMKKSPMLKDKKRIQR